MQATPLGEIAMREGYLLTVGALLTLCSALLATSLPVAAAEEAQPSGYELALVDTRGKKQVLGRLPASVFAPRLSPDGTHVAFEMSDPANADPAAPTQLWVADVDDFSKKRALPRVGDGSNLAPVWTPDGERLVFMVIGNGVDIPDKLYWRRADGKGEAEHLIDARAAEGVYDDGKQLSFITRSADGDYGVSAMDLATKEVKVLVDYPKTEQHSARLSPNGKWLAYASNERGTYQVWLEPVPQTGQRFLITPGGGRHPMWTPDGEMLLFDQGGQMFRQYMFFDGPKPQSSEPEALPIKGFQQGDLRRQFDLTPSGVELLMLFPIK
jgi:eukaryotic-like serine/threonine-protein kinase